MALLMLLGDGIGTLAYALVADYAKAHFHGAIARTAFYNELDLGTNLLGAALQLTLTRWLLVRCVLAGDWCCLPCSMWRRLQA